MKCNVANKWCPYYQVDGGGCRPFMVVKDCQHRKRMNRLEKTFKKDMLNDLWWQWKKEKEK